MSTWFPETVTCPTCHHEQEARLARGVHAARAPEVREQVFARTFHCVTCERCAQAFTAGRAFVYTDTDRKHWVQVAPADQRVRWPEYETVTDRLFDRAMTGSPLTHELREGFTVRVVFGLEALREKLVVWQANLDDAIVECLKVRLVRDRPALARALLVVDAVADGALTVVADGSERITIPSQLVAQFHRDDDRLRARFPELFSGRFVSTFRLLGPRYRWTEP